MSYGIWPSFWKCAVITPIFKSGSAIDVENYGPKAFLLNSLLLERSIFNYIYPYVKVKISNSQHGFLKNRSTVTQLVEFVDLIYTCNDQNIATWTVYFDFRKAFDSVPHNILLNKWSIMVLDQKFIDLLSSYLRGRSQRVRVDGVLSESLEITSGVPQGSVLGPLLFLIFIDDLPDATSSSICFLFADDCKLTSSSSMQDLQTDIDELVAWSLRNGLMLNPDKTQLLAVSNGCGNLRARQYLAKINVKLTKANRTLHFMMKNIPFSCPIAVRAKFYKLCVLPSLLYASQVWSPSLCCLRKTENFHKRALRWVTRRQDHLMN